MELAKTGNARWQLIGFILVGAIGFLVDASVLSVLIDGKHTGPFLARAVSFPCAVTVTYFLNRAFTFSAQKSPLRKQEYFRYIVTQILGAATNFSVYVIILSFVSEAEEHPIAALAVGAIFGLAVNFVGSRYFVFTAKGLQYTDGK